MAPSAAVRTALLAAYALDLKRRPIRTPIRRPPVVDALPRPHDRRGEARGRSRGRSSMRAGNSSACLLLLTSRRRMAMPRRRCSQSWLHWLARLVYEGAGGAAGASSSWQRDRMEYAFALASRQHRARSDEYTDGHVDWEDFRAAAVAQQAAAGLPTAFAVASRHPHPCAIRACPPNATGSSKTASQLRRRRGGRHRPPAIDRHRFALTFGNDWFIVPVRLPVGWIYAFRRFRSHRQLRHLASRTRSQAAGSHLDDVRVTPSVSRRGR